MSPKRLFTLKPDRWYAMEVWDANWQFRPHASPVKIFRVTPLKRGDGTFKLSFFHANYPEGVQHKVYTLRTLHRSSEVLLAISVDPKEERALAFFPVVQKWLHAYWPESFRQTCDESAADTQALLERQFPRLNADDFED